MPNTELRLGNNTRVALDAEGKQTTSTPQDLVDMAQADVLIGSSSSFFELAAHLSEGVVFTSKPKERAWWTAAGDSPCAPDDLSVCRPWPWAWLPRPNVTQRISRWGRHLQFVGYDASGILGPGGRLRRGVVGRQVLLTTERQNSGSTPSHDRNDTERERCM